MRYSKAYFNHGGEVHDFGELKPRRKYGIMRFLFDCVMTIITHGFWFIWVIVREARK